MSRPPTFAVAAPSGDNYGSKSLLNVDGNFYSKSKRKRSQLITELCVTRALYFNPSEQSSFLDDVLFSVTCVCKDVYNFVCNNATLRESLPISCSTLVSYHKY